MQKEFIKVLRNVELEYDEAKTLVDAENIILDAYNMVSDHYGDKVDGLSNLLMETYKKLQECNARINAHTKVESEEN